MAADLLRALVLELRVWIPDAPAPPQSPNQNKGATGSLALGGRGDGILLLRRPGPSDMTSTPDYNWREQGNALIKHSLGASSRINPGNALGSTNAIGRIRGGNPL